MDPEDYRLDEDIELESPVELAIDLGEPDEAWRPDSYADLACDGERMDQAFVGRGFRSWVVTVDPRKGGVTSEGARPFVEWFTSGEPERFDLAPRKFKLDEYLKFIRREVGKEIPREEKARRDERYAELVRSLAICEAEWRAQCVTHDRMGMVMSISRTPEQALRADRLSYRNPAVDDRCSFTTRGGNRCNNYSVPGSPRCPKHGGALLDVEVRRAFLLSAYCSVVEASQEAVGVLVEVARHGRNELARVAAAKEILDRAGLSPAINLNVNLGGKESEPLRQLRDRLDRIQTNLKESQVIDVTPVEESEAPGG